MEPPAHFPEIEHSDGNEYTKERWKLGKKLFYEKRLSKDQNVSCNSCHNPELAFSDHATVSIGSGLKLGTRNSSSLTNIGYHPYLTREGGVPTLEMQILVPIQEHNEFNNNIISISDSLKTIDEYVDLSQSAYNSLPTPFVITRALALFERSLISGQSFYDMERFYDIEGSMTESAKRGEKLFFSDRTSCSDCHSGFNFTNYSFESNGLYSMYNDTGRQRLTQKAEDNGLFKIPSLRNVEYTSPYMHDGSLVSLDEVIDHYNSGGENHINKSELIRPLGLSEKEKKDLISFLNALSDETFINNPIFRNE